MFYSPVYLKKSGKFGLIWLAATQSKVLSKRELVAINVAVICSNIFSHIPGMKEQGSRASRFSLYLCCQLMYGSVKVLQKQWEFLLVEAQALSRRCLDAPSSTKDIDLAEVRQAMTIQSRIPSDAKDPNFDPYFGMHKEPHIDVDSMLTYLESISEDKVLVFEPLPLPVRPEIGSPHSVSDPKEIQIQEFNEIAPITAQLPGEQDLPMMDMESFLSMSLNESLQEIHEHIEGVIDQRDRHDQATAAGDRPSLEQQILPETEDRNVTMMREILMDTLPQTDLTADGMPLLPLEETPLVKATGGMPAPPHKPRLERPKKPRDPNKKESRFKDLCNDDEQRNLNTSDPQVPEQTAAGDPSQQHQTEQKAERAKERGHSHDWAQRNPPAVNLPSISPVQSPIRKRRPHKLVIDQVLMLTRAELREHMENTDDIISELELPITSKQKNVYQEPGVSYIREHKTFSSLFSRNLKFGLSQEDTGSEQDSLTSPRLEDFLSRKRARRQDEAETPATKIPRISEMSSIEKARASGGLSMSIERNRSHSIVDQLRDESAQSIGSSLHGQQSVVSDNDISREGVSILEHDGSLVLPALNPLPEDQELRISPIRRPDEPTGQVVEGGESRVETAAEVQVPAMIYDQSAVAGENRFLSPPQVTVPGGNLSLDLSAGDSPDTPRTKVFKLVESSVRTRNDWVTFQDICPTASCNRKTAASMFMALCAQIGRGKLRARQDEPYTSIFIWLPENISSSGE